MLKGYCQSAFEFSRFYYLSGSFNKYLLSAIMGQPETVIVLVQHSIPI